MEGARSRQRHGRPQDDDKGHNNGSRIDSQHETAATGRHLLQGELHIVSNRNERQRVLRNRPTLGAATGACDSASHLGSRTRQDACTPTATTTATSGTFALALTRHEGRQYGGLCWGCRCGPTEPVLWATQRSGRSTATTATSLSAPAIRVGSLFAHGLFNQDGGSHVKF
jgi:hypothetical protein